MSTRRAPFMWKIAFQALIIATLGFLVYWPTLHGDWQWDDDTYIVNNRLLTDPLVLWKIWFVPGTYPEYYPLEESLQWLQWLAFGNEPFGYHLVNLLLHLIGSFLAWRFFDKLGLRFAWLGGLIFVVHPLTIESVAWASEFKNTASLPPLLLALIAYIDYRAHESNSSYWLSCGCFTAALLCKISAVFFPLSLLLYIWWIGGRISQKDLRSVAPFLVVALILGVITILAYSLNTTQSAHVENAAPTAFSSRVIGSGVVVYLYLYKYFFPFDLLPLYAPPQLNYWSYLVWPTFFLIIYFFWMKRKSWGRHALVGLGFFFINLLPVVGFILIKYDTMVWSLDHLTYISLIGLVGLTVAGMNIFSKSSTLLPCIMGVLGFFVLFWIYVSCGLARKYTSQQSLWAYTIQHNPASPLAHNNYGLALSKIPGDLPAAILEYKMALSLAPSYMRAHNNLGSALAETPNSLSQAVREFEEAIRLEPDYAPAHSNLGLALSEYPKQLSAAITECQRAILIQPDNATCHNSLGIALARAGRTAEALAEYQSAIRLDPNLSEAHTNMGIALSKIPNRLQDAIDEFQRALQLNPDLLAAHYNLGRALVRTPGGTSKAITQFRIVLQLDPGFEPAQQMLKYLHAEK